MGRALIAFACVACALSAAAACSAPPTDIADPSAPQAQATSVRRTEVAEVQRIIANNATSTPTTAPTLAAPPTCQGQGAIWWYEARGHVGESRTVQGTIVGSRIANGGLMLLELGQRYPDPIGVVVLLNSTSGSILEGKTVCVAGQITYVEGRPTMRLQGSTNIQVMN